MRANHQYNYNYKLDQIFSREKSYDLHLKKLNEIKSKKSSSQSRVQHIEILEKRNSIRQQRRRFDLSGIHEFIQQNNLKEQIEETVNYIKKQQKFATDPYDCLYHPHNLNLTFRKNQAQQIQYENIKLADRLMKQEPVLKLEEFSHSYKENKRMMLRLQRYQQCQNYVASIRNNITLTNRDNTNISQISQQKKKDKLQPIITVKNKSIDATELDRMHSNVVQEEDSQVTDSIVNKISEQNPQKLAEIPQLGEESQQGTIKVDEVVDQQIQQQIENEVKQQEEQSEEIEQQ